MHMLDWNAYRQQLVAGVGGFGKLNRCHHRNQSQRLRRTHDRLSSSAAFRRA